MCTEGDKERSEGEMDCLGESADMELGSEDAKYWSRLERKKYGVSRKAFGGIQHRAWKEY